MTENINPIGPAAPQPPQGPKTGKVEGERSFQDILKESIDKVNQLQQDADLTLEKFLKEDPSVKQEQVMVAFRKAQVAFETMLQIRNKLVDAFEQIQQMRV